MLWRCRRSLMRMVGVIGARMGKMDYPADMDVSFHAYCTDRQEVWKSRVRAHHCFVFISYLQCQGRRNVAIVRERCRCRPQCPSVSQSIACAALRPSVQASRVYPIAFVLAGQVRYESPKRQRTTKSSHRLRSRISSKQYALQTQPVRT